MTTTAKQKSLQLEPDYKATFGSEAGGRVLLHLAELAGMTSSAPIDANPYSLSNYNGRQTLVYHILDMVEMTPVELHHRLREAKRIEESRHPGRAA